MQKALTWLGWGGAQKAVNVKALVLFLVIHGGGAAAALRSRIRVEAIQGGRGRRSWHESAYAGPDGLGLCQGVTTVWRCEATCIARIQHVRLYMVSLVLVRGLSAGSGGLRLRHIAALWSSFWHMARLMDTRLQPGLCARPLWCLVKVHVGTSCHCLSIWQDPCSPGCHRIQSLALPY